MYLQALGSRFNVHKLQVFPAPEECPFTSYFLLIFSKKPALKSLLWCNKIGNYFRLLTYKGVLAAKE
jgi:hypothetical protein